MRPVLPPTGKATLRTRNHRRRRHGTATLVYKERKPVQLMCCTSRHERIDAARQRLRTSPDRRAASAVGRRGSIERRSPPRWQSQRRARRGAIRLGVMTRAERRDALRPRDRGRAAAAPPRRVPPPRRRGGPARSQPPTLRDLLIAALSSAERAACRRTMVDGTYGRDPSRAPGSPTGRPLAVARRRHGRQQRKAIDRSRRGFTD